MNMISRDTYKNVKRMNREQLNDFLIEIYDRGALESEQFVSPEMIEERIKQIPGIGEKRLEQIMKVINELFDEVEKEFNESKKKQG